MMTNGPVMNATARARIKPWQVILLLTATVIVAAAAYSTRRKVVEVQVASPAYRDLESTVATGGTVVPLHEFPARANFSGIIIDIPVHLGQKVRAGELLMTMKDQYALARVENARAALEAAEVGEQNTRNNGSPEDRIGFAEDRRRAVEEKQQAEAALSTLKELRQKGSVSDAEVAAGAQRLQVANETLRALDAKDRQRFTAKDLAGAKVKVAAARAALSAERVSYNNANITSPISGTVFLIPVNQYDFVPMGADLLRVADLTKIQVHADFDEPDIAKLHTGEPVKIGWEGRPNRVWHGHVVHAPMAVTAAGPRNIGQCTIAVDDADGDLPADSHVTVTVTIDTHRHALAIPREALYTDGQSRFVYRVINGRLAKTVVRVGISDLFQAEITSGLTTNDVIALKAPHGEPLTDHLRVITER